VFSSRAQPGRRSQLAG